MLCCFERVGHVPQIFQLTMTTFIESGSWFFLQLHKTRALPYAHFYFRECSFDITLNHPYSIFLLCAHHCALIYNHPHLHHDASWKLETQKKYSRVLFFCFNCNPWKSWQLKLYLCVRLWQMPPSWPTFFHLDILQLRISVLQDEPWPLINGCF